MSDFTLTTNLSLKKPAIGGSSDKWGEYLNSSLDDLDTAVGNLQNASTSRSLESLSNVLDTTPTTGQLLQYDTASWKAATVSIPDNIQDLTNVTVTSPADGQVLAYSTSNSRWENQTPGAATIPDGTITNAKLDTSLQGQVALILQTTGTPTDNQIVRYDSTSANWEFQDLPGGTVSALSDTDVSSIANQDVLVYNSTSGNWVSRPLAIADVTNLQTTLNAKLESADISVSSLSDTTITTTADDSFLVYDSSDSNWKNEGPSTVRSTLSLVVGTNVQAQSARLDDISSLAVTDGNFIVGSGTAWVAESGATARASLGLGNLATQDTITESQISDLGSYITASSTDTLTNKSGNISQFTNDSGYLTAESNDLSTVSGTLGTANGGTGLTAIGTANQVLAVNAGATALEFQTLAMGGTVTSVAVSGSDGIEIDSGSPITSSGTIVLGINATSLSTHLGLGNLATQDTITESQISDLGSYITASSTDTLTNKSGNISQWTNDSNYLTAETNNLSTVSGTLGTANGGTGLTAIGTANQVLAVNSGATALEFQTISITESQISDLQTYLTTESNNLTSAVTWADVPDANITQSSVTQHETALSITESQITDLGSYLTAETNDLGSAVTGTLGTANGGTGLTSIGTAGQVLTVNSGATALEYQTPSSGGISAGKAIALAMIFG